MSTVPIENSGHESGLDAAIEPAARRPDEQPAGILPSFDWSVLNPGEAAIHIVPEFVARRYLAFPARVDGRKLTMVMSNPGDYYAIKKTVGLRVGKDQELRGLDIEEHGMEAYSGFQIFVTR